jgi:anti-sigma factor ChrR (cupin superfamily)
MDSKLYRPDPATAGTNGVASNFRLRDIFGLASRPDEVAWQPFRPNVEIYRIYGDGTSGPSAALIRFQPGGEVDLHEHDGFEHILVLSGSQRDDNGESGPGTLIVNPPGTRHRIVSPHGCVVLAIYEKPVRFLGEDTPVA